MVVEDYDVLNSSSNIREISESLSDTFDKFKNNIHKIEEFSYDSRISELSTKVESITEELSSKLNTTDLEKAMLSHLMILDENFKSIRNEIKGINKDDLRSFKNTVSNLEELISHSITSELPKHKKLITDNEFRILNKFEQFSSNVEGELEIVDGKIERFSHLVDEQLNDFNEEILNTKNEVLSITETYKKLHKIVENKSLKENEKLEHYQDVLDEFNQRIEIFEEQINQTFDEYKLIFTDNIKDKFKTLSSDINEKVNLYLEKYNQFEKTVNSEVSSVKKDVAEAKADIIVNEQHIKGVSKELEIIEQYIQENRKDIIDLKEDIYSEIEKLPVGNIEDNIRRIEKKLSYIQEVYSKIEPETIIKETFSEPPSTKNKDPLTPLDQNFVTLDQLQQHYRLFINRIQQQISTLGGGGETQLKYLDDIVGIATNPSSYDGKFLKYDHSSKKFEFTDVSSASVGIEVKKEGVVIGAGITSIDFVGGSVSNITVSSGVATVTIISEFQYLNQLLDVDVSGVNDKYVIMYDAVSQKYKAVDPDVVLAASVTTNAGIDTTFLSALDVDLDNRIDLDGGDF